MEWGLPLFSTLTVSQFRAVLAHEFGHYYGGDASLGPWVYKTEMAIIRVFENIGSVGQTGADCCIEAKGISGGRTRLPAGK